MTDQNSNRPYTSQKKVRLAISTSVLALGLLLVSSPAWLFQDSTHGVFTNAIVGLAGALIGFSVASFVNELFNPTFDAVIEAFDLHADPANGSGFGAMIRREVLSAVSTATEAPADFGPRAQMVQKLSLATAREKILIQSISLSQKWQIAQTLEELFKTNPSFTARVLLIHPYSPHALARDQDLGFSPGTIRQLVSESILPLASLRDRPEIGDRLQVRGYWALPYFGVTIVDSTRVLVSLSREGRGGDQNYACLINGAMPHTSAMISDLERGFHERWRASNNIMEAIPLEIRQLADDPVSPTGNIILTLSSHVELLPESVRLHIDNGIVVEAPQDQGGSIRFAIKPHGSGIVRVHIEESLSKDKECWLARPVELSVDPGVQP